MKLLTRIFTGLGIGSFLYLLIKLSKNAPISISHNEIISTFIISIIAGELTILFDSEKISFFLALLIHFIAVNMSVLLTSTFNGWESTGYSLDTLFSTSIIYLIAWGIVIIKSKVTARELNKVLKESRK